MAAQGQQDSWIADRNATGGGRMGTDQNRLVQGKQYPQWNGPPRTEAQNLEFDKQNYLFNTEWKAFAPTLQWAGFFILLIAIGFRVPVWTTQTDGKNLMPPLNYIQMVIAVFGMAIFGGFLLVDKVEYVMWGMLVGALIMLGTNAWQHYEIAQYDVSGPTSGPNSDDLSFAKRNGQLCLGASTAVLFVFIVVLIYYLVKWNKNQPKWN